MSRIQTTTATSEGATESDGWVEGLHVRGNHGEHRRQHVAASAQFTGADERMSKQARVVQTPTLPGPASKEIIKTLLRLSLFASQCIMLFLTPF